MTVLAVTAGLAHVAAFRLGGPANGFAVGDLGFADGGLDLELAQQAVHDDLQVELAHAGDDGLSGLLVGVGFERRVFLGQLDQRHGHFILTGFGLGLDGDLDHGIRELHRFEDDLVAFVAQRIGGGGVLRPTMPQISPL
jgi:hypothetical protein